jgi:hypothetical protein
LGVDKRVIVIISKCDRIPQSAGGGLSPQCDNDAISAAARARKRVTLHCAHCDPTQKPATLILYGFGWDLPRRRRRRCRGLAVVVVRSVTGEGVFTVREYHRRDFISSSSSISRWWLTHDTCIWFWMLVSHLCVCMCGIFAPVWPLTKKNRIIINPSTRSFALSLTDLLDRAHMFACPAGTSGLLGAGAATASAFSLCLLLGDQVSHQGAVVDHHLAHDGWRGGGSAEVGGCGRCAVELGLVKDAWEKLLVGDDEGGGLRLIVEARVRGERGSSGPGGIGARGRLWARLG